MPRPWSNLFFGEKSAEKLCVISFSNEATRHIICERSLDITEQVIQEIHSADVQSCSKLNVFVRYVHSGGLKEEFLFCDELELITKCEDVLDRLSEFFDGEDLYWRNLCGVSTDGSLQCLGLDQAS